MAELYSRQEKATIVRIEKAVDVVANEMGLDAWFHIRHRFSHGLEGDTATENGTSECSPTVAITTTQWTYRQARITWHLPMVTNLDDHDLELIVIHELVHILINPLSAIVPEGNERFTNDILEFTAESVARAIAHVRGMEDVR